MSAGGATAVVLAAGSGERLGAGTPKAFVEVAGRPLLLLAAEAAAESPAVDRVVAVVPAGYEESALALLGTGIGASGKAVAVVRGGPTRQSSVRAALEALSRDVRTVVCHDAARPVASPELFSAVIAGLEDADGVVPVVAVSDTVKRVRGGFVIGTEPRGELALAQTPQAFRGDALREAHARAERDGVDVTDDAALLERSGYRVRAVPGDERNFKITTAEDLARAEALLAHGSPAGSSRSSA